MRDQECPLNAEPPPLVDVPPGTRAEGHAALQRGGDRLREERRVRRERVAAGVVLRQPAGCSRVKSVVMSASLGARNLGP